MNNTACAAWARRAVECAVPSDMAQHFTEKLITAKALDS